MIRSGADRLLAVFRIPAILFASVAILAASPGVSAFTIPWGDAPGQLGLINQPEQERTGPLTFAAKA